MKLSGLAGIVLCLAGAVVAGEKVTPVLAPNAKVIAILKSLGDGQSANLPNAKTTGDLNKLARSWGLDRTGPRVRDWSVKMMWMPDRKRAGFFGAGHNTMRINDVWEHDLPSNTWVCLYGPDSFKNSALKNWADTELKDGIWVTKRGGPGIIGHQWQQCTYDPELKALVFWNSWFSPPKAHVAKFVKPGEKAPPGHKPPLWLFHPEKKKWEPVKGKIAKYVRPMNGANGMAYVPALKGALWYSAAAYHGPRMLLYNSKKRAWTELPVKGKSPGGDPVLAWVPDRKVLIAASGKRGGGVKTCIYDPAKGEWQLASESKGPARAYGCMSFAYDPVGKVCLLYDGRASTLWIYDLAKAKWSKAAPKGAAPPKGRGMGYYDFARNAFVLCVNNKTWVYRHKKASK